MTTTADCQANPKGLISSDLFARLVAQVMKDARVNSARAERIMQQALVFLKACADNPGSNLSPTSAVDPGWHAFILYTEEYAKFCDRIAGGFIHHRPICDDSIRSSIGLVRTVHALEKTGYPIDEELWRVDVADCNQCHAGCHDSP